MKLSIVILAYNSQNLLKYCLKSIKEADLSIEHEIIVVDNASKDDIAKMMQKEHPEIKFIKARKNRGYAAGNNLGLKKATGDYMLILNPDIIVKKDELEKMINFMEKHPQIGMLGPKLINVDGSLQYSCRRFPKWWTPIARRSIFGKTKRGKQEVQRLLMHDYDHREGREVGWLFGAALLMRGKALDEIGLLDEKFFMYFEDIDWCRRFWQKKWKVYYFPQSELTHYYMHESAQKIMSKINLVHIASWWKYLWKWRGEREKGKGKREKLRQ